MYRDVGTNEPSATAVPRLNKSASKWTKADLLLLGVDYQFRRFDDIPIGDDTLEMPPELLGSG